MRVQDELFESWGPPFSRRFHISLYYSNVHFENRKTWCNTALKREFGGSNTGKKDNVRSKWIWSIYVLLDLQNLFYGLSSNVPVASNQRYFCYWYLFQVAGVEKYCHSNYFHFLWYLEDPKIVVASVSNCPKISYFIYIIWTMELRWWINFCCNLLNFRRIRLLKMGQKVFKEIIIIRFFSKFYSTALIKVKRKTTATTSKNWWVNLCNFG